MPGETPILVLEVASIEEHLKKIEAAGGKAQMEILPIGDMGFYTRFVDPEGNVMGLWQNA
jgi:predicted enzyme related to lactoylglutathione lyase